MTTRARRESRAARRREWAESRKRRLAESLANLKAKRAMLPPMGEPIKIGHHSEAGHRKAFTNVERAAARVVENAAMMERHTQAAETIERELGRSIYSDDDDAPAMLRERIADLEVVRDRQKAVNRQLLKAARAAGPVVDWHLILPGLDLTDVELQALEETARITRYMPGIHPKFNLASTTANIARLRKRLVEIEGAE